MANTRLSDVWVPQTFQSYQMVDPVMVTSFVESGIITTIPMFNELASGPGFITSMPYWNRLDSSIEPNYSNDVYTDIADTQKVTAFEMLARVSELNEGWNSMDLVVPLSGKDPLKLVAAEVDRYWREQLQRRLIATVTGVWNANVAQDAGDMTIDVSDAAMAVDALNKFSADTFVRGIMTLGDQFNNVVGMAMHSMIYGTLVNLDMITFIADSNEKLTIPTYMGKVVIVDDGMPVVGGNGTTVAYKYLTVLFGRGAFGYGNGTAHVPSAFEREEARGNGGGTESLWSRKRWLLHPFGHSFLSTTITGPGLAPTWADLRLAANWDRKVSRKNVPIIFLVTNA